MVMNRIHDKEIKSKLLYTEDAMNGFRKKYFTGEPLKNVMYNNESFLVHKSSLDASAISNALQVLNNLSIPIKHIYVDVNHGAKSSYERILEINVLSLEDYVVDELSNKCCVLPCAFYVKGMTRKTLKSVSIDDMYVSRNWVTNILTKQKREREKALIK